MKIDLRKKYIAPLGSFAVELDEIVDLLDTAHQPPANKMLRSTYASYLEFTKRTEFADTVRKLSQSKSAYARELAGLILYHLYCAPKYTVQSKNATAYRRELETHTKALSWTEPILAKLLEDRNIGPTEIGLFAVRELSDISEESAKQYIAIVQKLSTHRSATIRINAVKVLPVLYPMNDEARNTLDRAGIEILINATRDPSIEVRDWACFVLWNNVENMVNTIEEALLDVVSHEDQSSDVYMEATIGLCIYGNKQGIENACYQLREPNFGLGWLDAVTESSSSECLLALIDAYMDIVSKNSDDSRLDGIEECIEGWNA